MASVTLTISSPILSGSDVFDVEIKDGGGSVVYSSTETNVPFNVTGLFPGNYVAYYTNGENTSQYCFTIPPCGCPTVLDAVITERGGMPGNYDFIITYDMSLYTPTLECGFYLHMYFPDGSAAHIAFTNLFRMTNIGGDIWTWTYPIYAQTSLVYNIYQTYDPDYVDGILCTGDTSVEAAPCHGPLTTNSGTVAAPNMALRISGSSYFVDIDYSNCGVDCDTVTWNYIQKPPISSGSLDSGTFSDTVTCSPLLSATHALAPAPTPFGTVSYDFVGTDCCGNTYSKTLTICTPVIVFGAFSLSGQVTSNFIKITFTACNSDYSCNNVVRLAYRQSNSCTSCTPDSNLGSPIFLTINCGALPDVHMIPVTPTALAVGEPSPRYDVNIIGCCLNYSKNTYIPN